MDEEIKPPAAKRYERLHISFSPAMLEQLDAQMKAAGQSSRSAYLALLVRRAEKQPVV